MAARYLVAKAGALALYSIVARRMDEALIPTRASLLARLKDWRDQSSWQEFFDTYWRLIYGVARRAGLDDGGAQDVVQETLLSVAKHMPTFEYNPAIGSFKGWLLKLTRWRIIDQLRKRPPLPARRPTSSDEASGTATVERLVAPESLALDKLWQDEWEKNLLDAAIANVKRRLDPQKYQIYDFYVNKGWPAEKVAAQFHVPVGQVHLAKHRVTELIRSEVRRLEREMT
jgi:RNA polymerase sigma-70 factor (ECF subfamily)